MPDTIEHAQDLSNSRPNNVNRMVKAAREQRETRKRIGRANLKLAFEVVHNQICLAELELVVGALSLAGDKRYVDELRQRGATLLKEYAFERQDDSENTKDLIVKFPRTATEEQRMALARLGLGKGRVTQQHIEFRGRGDPDEVGAVAMEARGSCVVVPELPPVLPADRTEAVTDMGEESSSSSPVSTVSATVSHVDAVELDNTEVIGEKPLRQLASPTDFRPPNRDSSAVVAERLSAPNAAHRLRSASSLTPLPRPLPPPPVRRS
ncbi:hypothetical protein [Methyloraptor flagellatus]|uniref:Uncharacterized protein n=1 Tax=Methyloraptor flagellatus TaxID=3162530 RepID=A0AAU7X4V8_9HYPH